MGSAMCTCTFDQPSMGPHASTKSMQMLKLDPITPSQNLEVSTTQLTPRPRKRAGSPWSRASVSRLVTTSTNGGTSTMAQRSNTGPLEWSGSAMLEVVGADAVAVAEATRDEPFVALQLPAVFAEKLQSLSSGNTDEKP